MNKWDKLGMSLAFLVGPAAWIITGDWRLFAVAALAGIVLGVTMGTPPASRPQPVREGKVKTQADCKVACAGGCSWPKCVEEPTHPPL